MVDVFPAFLFVLIALLMMTPLSPAATPATLPVDLPDALRMNDGTPVRDLRQWELRRTELIRMFTEQMYGVMPARPARLRFEVFEADTRALGGRATRKQVAIYLNELPNSPHIELLLYLPNAVKRPAVILGLNFWGNQSISTDPAVRLPTSYLEEGRANGFIDLSGVKDNLATEATRGIDAARWPLEQIIDRGYALATIYRGDIDPDLANNTLSGVRALYPELKDRPDNFSAIGAWAWGLMRGMDYLQTDTDVDARRVIAFGWSRLGKAALWAVANDMRFAGLLSSESGSGGAKLFHHDAGENISRLATVFPHWYSRQFARYVRRDTNLPFDQHEVVALVAPRPIYVASSHGDEIFDPVGEWLGLKAAEPVYRLYGPTYLPAEMPAINQPVIGLLSYHWRDGQHDVKPFDWNNYLKFCDEQVVRKTGL